MNEGNPSSNNNISRREDTRGDGWSEREGASPMAERVERMDGPGVLPEKGRPVRTDPATLSSTTILLEPVSAF